MLSLKYLAVLPFLIKFGAAANCYSLDSSRIYNSAATTALNNLSWNGGNRRCVYTGSCKACYRTSGQPARFNEAKGNIQDQCLAGSKTYGQGYWEADGLRVCFDCVNSGNCNDTSM
ncbi:hypothetical protein TWF694_009176 [Orbilia ellipsospora]|uniref:Uncharacterized protein n=1 Tax=Orbilia ellipsospora TaxID=2528407 RepID=A0AAV9XF37_9PEZI